MFGISKESSGSKTADFGWRFELGNADKGKLELKCRGRGRVEGGERFSAMEGCGSSLSSFKINVWRVVLLRVRKRSLGYGGTRPCSGLTLDRG